MKKIILVLCLFLLLIPIASAQLPYWIKGTSEVYVKVPTIEASGDTVLTIEKTGSYVPNGDDTFLIFDDFPGSSLNASKWNSGGTGAVFSVASGALTMKSTSYRGNYNIDSSVYFATAPTNYFIEALIKSNTNQYRGCQLGLYNISETTNRAFRGIRYHHDYATGDETYVKRAGSATVSEGTAYLSSTAYQTWTSYATSTTTYGLITGTTSGDSTRSVGVVPAASQMPVFFSCGDDYGTNYGLNVDYIFARNYADILPTVAVTDEGTYYEVTITNTGSELTDYEILIDAADLGTVTNTESLEVLEEIPQVIIDNSTLNMTSDGGCTAWAGTSVSTDGTITTDGLYTVVNFSSNGTFNVTGELTNLSVLMVAGGAGGGSGGGAGGGGGGAGGLIYKNANYTLSNGNYNIVVGEGGTGTDIYSTKAENGGDSTFDSLTAVGGGYGGNHNAAGATWDDGNDGGSGGGTSYDAGTVGQGTAGQGNNGGLFVVTSSNSGGGGGGASAVGAAGAQYAGGAGGIGTSIDINGAAIYYAGGGAGGTNTAASSVGLGGLGGGGNGEWRDNTIATAGTDGLGGGGGGHTAWAPGASPTNDGGDGVVIIRYLTSLTGLGDKTIPCNTTDGTPTVTFDTNIAGSCSLRNVAGNYSLSHICGTTGSTSHVCTVYDADKLSYGLNNLYASCSDGTTNVTTGAMSINMTAGTPEYISCVSNVGYGCGLKITNNCAVTI